MKQKRKAKSMEPSYTPYIQLPYTYTPTFGGVGWAEMMIEAGTLTHDEIPTFSFAPLDEIRKDLAEAGHSEEEIESTIVGLSELPEYASSQREQTRRK